MFRRDWVLLPFVLSALSVFGVQPRSAKPTYSKDIAPILNKRCVSCHSESRIAPFSLVGYENARQKAATIARVTTIGYMPPWKAKPNYGEFRDVASLSAKEKDLLAKWAAAGAPEGNPSEAPPVPKFTPGWRLGKPDMTISPEKATTIPSEGVDFYRDYLIDPHITKPTWVRAVDFYPSQKGTVHHVIPSLISKEDAEKLRKIKFDHPEDNSWNQETADSIDPVNTLGFWSTGAPPFQSPDGTAFLMNPGEQIKLDMHYKSTGRPETEQTKVGLYFLKEPPKQEMKVKSMSSNGIYLEPGQRDVRVFAVGGKTSFPTTLYAVWPHMHYLGRTFKAWVKFPGGYSKPLVCIADWDPDWQLLYYLKTPMEIPEGSRFYVSGTYDNSDRNPRNPNSPPRVIEGGPSSKDEMLFLELFQVVHKPPQKEPKAPSAAPQQPKP